MATQPRARDAMVQTTARIPRDAELHPESPVARTPSPTATDPP